MRSPETSRGRAAEASNRRLADLLLLLEPEDGGLPQLGGLRVDQEAGAWRPGTAWPRSTGWPRHRSEADERGGVPLAPLGLLARHVRDGRQALRLLQVHDR